MNSKMKIEDIKPVAELKNQLWQGLSFIRAVPIFALSYVSILYLLILQNKGLLEGLTFSNKEDFRKSIRDHFFLFVKENSKELELFRTEVEGFINDLGTSSFEHLVKLFRSLDQSVLHDHFPEIFDDLWFRFTKFDGLRGSEFIQPVELSRFICSLVELPEFAKVYNPFAGHASFGVHLDKQHFYIGQELNPTNWAIGKLRLMAYERENVSSFLEGDSINTWNPTSDKFDLIVTYPPFVNKLDQHIKGEYVNEYSTYEQFIIEKGINDLTPSGKLIVVVPQSFLYSQAGSEHIRAHWLIDKDLLEMVISLPADILKNTRVPVAILVINKDKKEKRKVRFIDGRTFFDNSINKVKRLNDIALLSIIKSNTESDSLRFVLNHTISDNVYSLHVPRYFQKQIDGIPLGKLIIPIKGPKNIEGRNGKYIRIRDLKEDKFDFDLNLQNIEVVEIPRHAQEISESCLLLATRWKSLKPTFFDYQGESIFIIPDTLAFRAETTKVDQSYLINELFSDYVIQQLEAYRYGDIIPYINKDDLLAVKIILPTLLEQRAKIQGVKEAFLQNVLKEIKFQKDLLGLKDDSFREFASIKHSFRQYLNALKANVAGTKAFISRNVGKSISLDTVYSKNLNRTLGEHLISLEGVIDSMSKLLLTADEMGISAEIIQTNNLKTLILEAQNRFKNPEKFEFDQLTIDLVAFSSDQGDVEPIVNIVDEDFYRMFSDIVSNAVDHGFRNTAKLNIVRTFMTYNSSTNSCVIEISNNGAPINREFTFKHLVTRGEKTKDSKGSGSGGPDIKSIVEKYGGTFELNTDEENSFPVTYVISFPLINTFQNEV